MFRSAASKVMWVGRATVFLVGLAVILALIFGVVSRATAHTGSAGLFHLNHNNPVSALSTLAGNLAGSVLKVDNNGAGPALSLEVGSGKAPLTVNSAAGKATNLNADKLDGLNSTDIGRQRWAVINSNGTIARSNGATGFTRKLGTGHYQVAFDTSVQNCAYVATTTGGFAGQTGVQEGSSGFSTDVDVFTVSSNGTNADFPFHLIVTC
jgi:hypothetical protein